MTEDSKRALGDLLDEALNHEQFGVDHASDRWNLGYCDGIRHAVAYLEGLLR